MAYLPLDLKIALFAVLAQVFLTFYAAIRMGVKRLHAIRSREVKLADIEVNTHAYPDHTRRYGNNLSNQFEFPILLYVAVMLSVEFNASSLPFAIACLAFVITRYYHRLIHVRSDNVVRRFYAFLVGLGLLILAWLFLVINIATMEYTAL